VAKPGRVDGVPELRRALRRLPAEAAAGAAAAMREAGAAMREDIRANMAADTGAARAGVQDRYTDEGLTVDVGVFDPDLAYIAYPEEGTTSQPAQPSMLPASERERLAAPRRVAEHIRRRLT
jgi:HK97 gp10 family phage protein